MNLFARGGERGNPCQDSQSFEGLVLFIRVEWKKKTKIAYEDDGRDDDGKGFPAYALGLCVCMCMCMCVCVSNFA